MRFQRLALATALSAAIAALASPAHAQQPAPGARTFLPADFTRYAPRSALDMLEQVPGFQIRQAEQARGLGQATGNVLVNGQRLSGKSADVLTQLDQVPAGNVVRIEIRDGATLGIPGLSGPVANVVTRADGVRGQWEWRPDVRRYFTRPQLTRGKVSVSGARGAVDYTVGLDNQSSHSGAGGGTAIFNADRTLREVRHDEWTGEYEQPRLTATLAWTGRTGQRANLNAAAQQGIYRYEEDGSRSGAGLPDRVRTVRTEEDSWTGEIGGDYAFGWGPGTLKVIGLVRDESEPFTTTARTAFADGRPDQGSRFARDGRSRERIARGEYAWGAGGDWQVSAEYAFNALDSRSRLATLGADGTFNDVPLPGGTATVQEDRVEVMATHGRKLAPTLALQASLGAEASRIEQAGGGGLSRSFRRPKGSVALNWTPRPGWQANATLERRVGQLNFYDFLASVDVSDDQASAGNPDLVPPQTWELELEAVRDFGSVGSTRVRAYVQRIDDIVDTIPIGPDGESPGNIDSATRRGIEWKTTLALDTLGWRGARVDTRVQAERSRVRDPLTGRTRSISGSLQDLAELSLRHDVPQTPWAWGSALSYGYYARDYRLTEVGHFWEGPVWGSVYVEHKDLAGLTVRASLGNALNARSRWDRTVYVDRRDGPVDFIEARDRKIGPILSFTVSGRF